LDREQELKTRNYKMLIRLEFFYVLWRSSLPLKVQNKQENTTSWRGFLVKPLIFLSCNFTTSFNVSFRRWFAKTKMLIRNQLSNFGSIVDWRRRQRSEAEKQNAKYLRMENCDENCDVVAVAALTTDGRAHPRSYVCTTEKKELVSNQVLCRVARWYFLKPKIPIWVNFGGSCNGRCWYILRQFGLFCGHLVRFMVIWYVFSRFGMLYREKSGNPAVHAPSHLSYAIALSSVGLGPTLSDYVNWEVSGYAQKRPTKLDHCLLLTTK
jgi:hypothetical protein